MTYDRTNPTTTDVPIRSAATVACARDGEDGLEVLLLRRAAGHVFCPGAHVFPGGAIDAADVDWASQRLARTERETPAVQDLARRNAIAREAFEEAGIIVGLHAPSTLNDDTLRQAQDDLNSGRHDWPTICRDLGLTSASESLVEIGFRQTPPGQPRRYATYFYLARASADAIARCDGVELDTADWWLPQHALASADTGAIELIGPTRVTLDGLARFNTVDDVFDAWPAMVSQLKTHQ